ncbi:hypothetical protein GCM10023340_19970 [Nocardioides marinquilinus]|uniref:PqqD family protein n=1 Tax=Nocardioides marinquilinus TaxID=1210400 RepID=A0ABP9PL24_9ACTN
MTRPSRVARSAWTDWYVDGDDSAVFVDDQVLVLSPLATRLLHHVDGEVTVASLADALVREFGAPAGGDATAATEAVVGELTASGVLVEVAG